MKAAIIAPTGLLKRYCRTGYHLALTHLVLKDEAYATFYRKASDVGQFVILDNSVIELGKPMPIEALEAAVQRVRPSELVLPDHPGRPATTLRSIERAGEYFAGQYPNMALMAVPQWNHQMKALGTWLQNMGEIITTGIVDTIGVPKFLGDYRISALEAIQSRRGFKDINYHLLGTSNVMEVQSIAETFPWVRGVDSKIPVRAGQVGIAFHPQAGLMVTRRNIPPMDFDNANDPMPTITSHNVRLFTQWAEGQSESNVLRLRR